MSSLQELQELVDKSLNITEVPVAPAVPTADKILYFWYPIVTGALYGSNKRLRAVSQLLGSDSAYTASALAVVRSSFEGAADLVYISKDVKSRLTKFLRHGLVPTDDKEDLEYQTKINSLGIEAFPNSRWMPLRQICDAIGWGLQYNIFYRYSSDVAHSGTSQLTSDYLELTGEPKSLDIVASTLCVALLYHLVVAEIAAQLFDGSINKEALESAIESCKSHMQQLAYPPTPHST